MDGVITSPALAAVAAHATLVLLTMFQMSMLRVNRAGGKPSDPTSYFAKASRVQELTVEWAGVLGLLCLGLHVQATAKFEGVVDPITTWAILASVVFRVVFTFAYLSLPNKNTFSIPRFLGALGSYSSAFFLAAALFAYL